eukprot:m.42095 g.42095  ORF g.42095 m.42095 type:complete len:350 (-) comp10489_c1_seq2:3645-4694(-)
MAQRFEVFEGLYEPFYDLQQEINRGVVWLFSRVDREVGPATANIELGSWQGLYVYFFMQLVALALIWTATHVLFDLIWPTFSKINPAHKKWYVVANFSKAFFLGMQCFSPTWFMYSFLQYRCTANPLLTFLNLPTQPDCNYHFHPNQPLVAKWAASTYVVTDVLAIFMVPKLPKTTLYHHVATGIFLFFVFHMNLDEAEVGRKVYLYGYWSTFSFMVNAFLSLRVLYEKRGSASKPMPLRVFAAVSAVIYSFCCFANWTLHLVWVVDGIAGNNWSTSDYVSNFIYLGALVVLVKDDLILMKWLVQYTLNTLPVKKRSAGKNSSKKTNSNNNNNKHSNKSNTKKNNKKNK